MGGSRASTVRLPRGDDGFTLVEAVVALFILGIIFTALAYAATGTLRASLASRSEQQGIDFAQKALEAQRQADYSGLANNSTDIVGDAFVHVAPGVCANGCIDVGDESTGELFEPLVLSPTGSVNPHIETSLDAANGTDFTIHTFVTKPTDPTAAYKRVTVVAQWSLGPTARTRSVSSLVTETSRGLPLPVFKLTPVGTTSKAVAPGAVVEFAFELTNQGAPDQWNLTAVGSGATMNNDAAGGQWEFYTDANGSPGERLIDSDAVGGIDTARIDPTSSRVFWAVRTLSNSATAGTYWSQITATSTAQTDAFASVDISLVISATASPGSTPTVTATPEPPPPTGELPGPPQSLQILSANGALVLTWAAPLSAGSSAIRDYVVQYKLPAATDWTTFVEPETATTGATITGLTNDVLYDILVSAMNSSPGVGTGAAGQGMPEDPNAYTMPVRCGPAAPVPAASANGGYSLKLYTLHNRSDNNPAWPGVGVPDRTYVSDGDGRIGQGRPLTMAVDAPQFPVGTTLLVYSADITADNRGRTLERNLDGFTDVSNRKSIDWRSKLENARYEGTAVMSIWVAPLRDEPITPGFSLTAQLFKQTAGSTATALGSPVSATGTTLACPSNTRGWTQVWFSLPVDASSKLGANTYLGVRLWNSSTGDQANSLRIAYDVAGDFPASLVLPEK